MFVYKQMVYCCNFAFKKYLNKTEKCYFISQEAIYLKIYPPDTDSKPNNSGLK